MTGVFVSYKNEKDDQKRVVEVLPSGDADGKIVLQKGVPRFSSFVLALIILSFTYFYRKAIAVKEKVT